ncbi:MAG: GPW/gp25 family protein [Oscillospiraceae bacterium]|nr:GPW/gp25 family protein [Oscillospiraceae bacterium]
MLEKEHMGSGMKFPPEVDASTGRIKISSAEEKIRESIYLILKTYKGERVILPQFGSELNSYVFSGTDTTTLNLMANSIKKALLKNEKRIKDLKIQVLTDKRKPGVLNIDISYVVAQNNQAGNMVFPFYIQEGIEGDSNGDE